jgi:plasmid stabilization system protein ParE
MIVFAEGALADLERILDFHAEADMARAREELGKIRSAVMILEEHPRIGRRVAAPLRELVISSPMGGYVALYQHDEVGQLVRVLAVRSQREAGYRGR